MHVTYSLFFPPSPYGGEQRMRRSSLSCANKGLTHPASASFAFPLLPIFFFIPSIFTLGYLCLFLVCYTAIPYIRQSNTPTDSPLLSLPSTSSSMWKPSPYSIISCCSCCCYSCNWLQLPPRGTENGGQDWDVRYVYRNVKIRFQMYWFHCEQQWYCCHNNGSQRVHNECKLP